MPSREPLPPHLLREEIVLEPDPQCPRCATTMQPLGEDVFEQLARVAAAFKVIRTIPAQTALPRLQPYRTTADAGPADRAKHRAGRGDQALHAG